MSTFKALNIESESESDEEPDDTQEIQIEEALKLFQSALKLHSEGPDSYDLAAKAYEELFKSEIFTYPDSLPESRRDEVIGVESDENWPTFEVAESLDQNAPLSEYTPNTLPQVIHLSRKNYGQFLLDVLEHKYKSGHVDIPTCHQLSAELTAPLKSFEEAISKDEADVDLWRRISILGEHIRSQRLTRLSLEAIIDENGQSRSGFQILPGPEKWYANEKLGDLIEDIKDDLVLSRGQFCNKHKLSKALLSRFRPYANIPYPNVTFQSEEPMENGSTADRATCTTLNVDVLQWDELGHALTEMFTKSFGKDNKIYHNCVYITVAHDSQPEITDQDVTMYSNPEADAAKHFSDDVENSAVQESARTPANDDEKKRNDSVEENEQVPPALARKRSTDSAGLPETAEGGRSRSKRIRARESIAEGTQTGDNSATDQARESEYLLRTFGEADLNLFGLIEELLEKLQIKCPGSSQGLRARLRAESEELPEDISPDEHNAIERVMLDVFSALCNCTEKLAQKLLQRNNTKHLGRTPPEVNFQTFTGSSKLGNGIGEHDESNVNISALKTLYKQTNKTGLTIEELSYKYLQSFLHCPAEVFSNGNHGKLPVCSYDSDTLTQSVRMTISRLIFLVNDYIYFCISQRLAALDRKILDHSSRGQTYVLTGEDYALIKNIQVYFELHLNMLTTDLQLEPDKSEIERLKKSYLERWARLSQSAMAYYTSCKNDNGLEDLILRYIWTFTFFLSTFEEVTEWQKILHLREVKSVFAIAGNPTIVLRNNEFMHELSIKVIDDELTRLSLKDFFVKVFEEKDPVQLIETLEPVMEFSYNHKADESEIASRSGNNKSFNNGVIEDFSANQSAYDDNEPSLMGISSYIQNGTLALRLSLWYRLREAYESIEYRPKIILCRFKIIEILYKEMTALNYRKTPMERRQILLMSWMGIIDQQITEVHSIMGSHSSTAFDFIDHSQLCSFIEALTGLLCVLYAYLVYEDKLRVGLLNGLSSAQIPSSTFAKVKIFLQDLHARLWVLYYILLQEADAQKPEIFQGFEEDKFSYIQAVHYVMAARGICKASKMAFVRFAKEELLGMKPTENVDLEIAQVLHDLYGLKCFINPVMCGDHGTSTGTLDKKIASGLLDFILRQTNKVNIKELHRTELKAAIDRVNVALSRPKQHESLVRNRKLFTSHIKSAINPLDLFSCLKGRGSLSTALISPNIAPNASKGWYFMMGSMILSKFRSQKRLTPIPAEELSAAATFFAQDIEYNSDCWESFYRAAQVFDLQVEEMVLWSAEKVNSNSSDLIQCQRSAIHCYMLATASAVRSHASVENEQAIAELYFDFGMRVYSSSRPPFGMEAFAIKESEQRYLSEATMFKARPFKELHPYTSWKFAAVLFSRSIQLRPDNWMSHYMLGKCLWKMYTSAPYPSYIKRQPSRDAAINAFICAIETLPTKKDNRRELIIEPHHKLASLMHKLFLRGEITPQEACQYLQASPHASKVPEVKEREAWTGYIIQVLKNLRTADKSNWHHRMTARAAHVLLENDISGNSGAISAKNELTQQIFTKTMTIQVWKPEHERPGRHFVYTSRYTLLFAKLLLETSDRVNFELLARKVRKKTHDFFKHTLVWTELVSDYLQLLRTVGNVPVSHEENVFRNINYDEFLIRASKLEVWCHSTKEGSPHLDILRETIDLKKLNASLAKLPAVDDLIGDTYALLYEQSASVHESPHPLPSSDQVPESAAAADAAPPGPNGSDQAAPQVSENLNDPTQNAVPKTALPTTMTTTATEQQSRARTKGVGRREVQRRAEAVAIKPANAAIPLRPPAQQQQQQQQQPPPDGKDAGKHVVQVLIELKKDGTGAESSAPGSVNDDADESEMSEEEEEEVEEVEEEKPLFPGLVRRVEE